MPGICNADLCGFNYVVITPSTLAHKDSGLPLAEHYHFHVRYLAFRPQDLCGQLFRTDAYIADHDSSGMQCCLVGRHTVRQR